MYMYVVCSRVAAFATKVEHLGDSIHTNECF